MPPVTRSYADLSMVASAGASPSRAGSMPRAASTPSCLGACADAIGHDVRQACLNPCLEQGVHAPAQAAPAPAAMARDGYLEVTPLLAAEQKAVDDATARMEANWHTAMHD